MKTISSRTNELIKHISSLQQKRQRSLHQEFVGEGSRVCTALIKSGMELKNIFVSEKFISLARKSAPEGKIILVTEHVMEKMSGATTPSGMLGHFALPKHPAPEKLDTGLVLAQISDPGNMGTLIRSAAALNKKTVVIVEGADPFCPKTVQASAGTIGMLHIFQWSWPELMAYKKDFSLVAMVVSGGKNPAEVSQKSLLVVGSEAHGIPQEWVNECDQKLTLPMPGNTESLNASVAGSIALYLLTNSI